MQRTYLLVDYAWRVHDRYFPDYVHTLGVKGRIRSDTQGLLMVAYGELGFGNPEYRVGQG
ncbi:hypothetical protein BDV28DRAFT_129104 [Aspergillus coremiiformis]|uniref:Uncharacterized protein n=1 Tax=Aspergillus coremiiformis TaxID=138285 RepID=A0A5N6ZGR5_9EURO|nr:hypothetical protein BDV28DRAFT_129104 [Aspergillus coremiiformis]